ncbi:MAG TPA: NAD(P)/FAD-dependent oxidoreductase, partial [Myxococcota bacterium]|nr:NAD(P)/FAD-dependent oxidoreductase [Myxococcota bacterium]
MPRIGIVGAGPGGLSLARLLTEHGHADVTVLERASRIGGKSFTLHHQGLGHEMGTCYTAAGYTVTQKWMKEAGITDHNLPHHFIRKTDGKLVDFADFVLGKGGMVPGGLQIATYANLWRKFHAWDVAGCPDEAEGTRGRAMRLEVAEPFGAWLKGHKLDVVARFAMRSMT